LGTEAPSAPLHRETPNPHWSFVTRVAFRFCVVYFGLYCFATQILGGLIPAAIDIPDLQTLWPMRQITFWVAAHIFRIAHPLVYNDSGSGDKTFDWVLAFGLLIIAAIAICIWSVLDSKRENYINLYKWFRLFIRFALASQMITYGMVKFIPLQMAYPFLTKLLEPFGHFSPMGVLWSSIGASPGYEMFAGSAELLAGMLLMVPRTTTLGALICLADTVQIFALNMTYDVPVKLLSFHLLLLALFLLAPDLSRLTDFFFRNRAAAPSTQPELLRTARANRIALVLQIIFGISLLAAAAYGARRDRMAYGSARVKSPLYGIWNVDQLAIDGQLRSPLLNDYDRWRRVVFDFPDGVMFQRMDDSFTGYGASINVNEHTLALTKQSDKAWKAGFQFQRPSQDQLILDGNMDGHKIHMQLQLVDRNSFVLVNRGFHWIQEYPFNR
jgi:hypothetical protein